MTVFLESFDVTSSCVFVFVLNLDLTKIHVVAMHYVI